MERTRARGHREPAIVALERCTKSARDLARAASAALLLRRPTIPEGGGQHRAPWKLLSVWHCCLHRGTSAAKFSRTAETRWYGSRPLRQDRSGAVRRVCAAGVFV